MSEQGLRHNEGKIRWDLMPFDGLDALARVYTKGAVKYAPRNWEKGMKWSTMLSSAMRHLFARMTGERVDAETGELHLAHFAWNALGLLVYDLRGIGENDLEDCAQGPRLPQELVTTYAATVDAKDLPAVPVFEPYEGVTREESRLGCSFLQGLSVFGARKK